MGSYYGEQSCVYLFGLGSVTPFKVAFLFFTFLGCNIDAASVIAFSDMMILGASFPNLLGAALMLGVLCEMVDDYFTRLHNGDMKRFEEQGTRSFVRASRPSLAQQQGMSLFGRRPSKMSWLNSISLYIGSVFPRIAKNTTTCTCMVQNAMNPSAWYAAMMLPSDLFSVT